MIEIKLAQGQIKRSTTAGKENTGTVIFMGGQSYIPNLDTKYKDGNYQNIILEAEYKGERFGWGTPSIKSVESLGK